MNPYSPVVSPGRGSSKLLNQYAPRGGVGGQQRELAGVGSRISGAIIDGLFVNLFVGVGVGIAVAVIRASGQEQPLTAAAAHRGHERSRDGLDSVGDGDLNAV